MPIILKKLYTKYELNRTQDKRVITVVAMVTMRYVADAYHTKKASYQI